MHLMILTCLNSILYLNGYRFMKEIPHHACLQRCFERVRSLPNGVRSLHRLMLCSGLWLRSNGEKKTLFPSTPSPRLGTKGSKEVTRSIHELMMPSHARPLITTDRTLNENTRVVLVVDFRFWWCTASPLGILERWSDQAGFSEPWGIKKHETYLFGQRIWFTNTYISNSSWW